ncbi:peptidyl-prolyl cis-trans isomerase-like 4 [Patiria miniata]|uniref:Peptidyl-prolyl cis-trans isomerase n=1 Tax=Patiria miniata TaxID=46514 RepID=A0A914A5D8_PATMI|nr:peptidyl-prolyl cis-trans isomerase-like 4 [Patiria miniata]
MAVLLETTLGDIVIDLYPEERPRCCLNFLKLCKIKYYNFSLFHSVQRNFMAQTGDPTGTGKGGDSIFSKLYGDQARFFEMETAPRIKHTRTGAVSMVNNGDNMHGSQFFFTLAENLDYLDGKHTVFGEISEGLDVLTKINEALVDKENRPYQDIRISHTVILDDPFDDPPGLEIPDRSPEPTKDQLESGRIGADENIDDTEGKTAEQVEEMTKEQESKARAQILEMVGDLPDADVKPPENVLFVCKLNPVTTSEDLEVIFSRFGQINSCEVIKDQKTEESLQYAFVEFEREEDCENAFFKMDNVLIDDRRIHVDFSQSVAKVNFKGKGPMEIPQGSSDKKPKFELKDKSRQHGTKYDLVLEGDDMEAPSHHASGSRKRRQDSSEDSSDGRSGRSSRKSKAKQKKHRDSSSSSEGSRRRKKEKRRKHDSSSEDDTHRDRHRERNRDRDRGETSRSDRRDDRRDDRDGRGKDSHRDKGRDKGRDDRGRDDWDRGRGRDWGADRHTDGDRHRRDDERDRVRDRGRERDRDRDRYRDRR